ncbi:hypothetical protein N752_14035 [Desulforamulus aquiferis]|nr:hypothetical protein [Desulforamulus aquiferis]RYD04488.1 hypothetical protein N752_14035 [Desulforamulus aquiferis]
MVDNTEVLLGTIKLMKQHNISFSQWEVRKNELEQQGKTVMLMAVGGNPAGMLAVADTVKDESASAIKN